MLSTLQCFLETLKTTILQSRLELQYAPINVSQLTDLNMRGKKPNKHENKT